MTKWLQIILQSLISSVRSRRDLAFENLLLRQQLAAMKHCQPRAKLSKADRIFWVLFSKFWPNWRDALHIVKPETVVRWHRQGFRYYWTWKSRRSGIDKLTNTVTGMWDFRACFDLKMTSQWALASIYWALRPLSCSASPCL